MTLITGRWRGRFDYIGVAMHEMSEIMGRIGLMGANLDGNPDYMMMDLLHYTGANVRGSEQRREQVSLH